MKYRYVRNLPVFVGEVKLCWEEAVERQSCSYEVIPQFVMPNVENRSGTFVVELTAVEVGQLEEDGYVDIGSVMQNGIEYAVIDVDRNCVGVVTAYEHELTEISNKSPLDKRIEAFKAFLLSKGDTYQKAYEAIGEPTELDLWGMLQKDDEELFKKGIDDFFKDVSRKKIIKFPRNKRLNKVGGVQ